MVHTALVRHRSRVPVWPWLLFLLLVVAAPSSARANPVNAEKLMSGPVHDGWKGGLESRISLSNGNVDRLDFATTGSLQFLTLYPEGAGHRRPPPEGTPPFFRDRWVLITNGTFIRAGGKDITNKGFGHTRYTRMWIPRLGSDFFAQVQFNEFTRLRVRIIGGVGARVDPVRTHYFQLWGGSGYMIEYELNDTVDGDPHPAELVNHRWTNYVAMQLRLLQDRLLLQNTTYVQPLLTDFSDFRVLDAVQLEGRIADNLAMGFDFQVQYDSRPPQEIVPLDLLLGSYLRLSFG